jgi:chromate reductase
MTAPRILAFAGSAKKASLNKKLIRIAANMANEQGADVNLVDLADFEAPVFNEDYEAKHGLPNSMKQLKVMMVSADGFLIATPEYNGFFPALIKNTFDWCTRVEKGETPMAPTTGKRVGIVAASPGGRGGIRAIPRLRDCLAEYGIMAVPGFATVPMAGDAFGEDGDLNNEASRNQVAGVVERLLAALR